MLRLASTLAPFLAALLIVGCGDGGTGAGGGASAKVNVVTTLPLFADFVREVGGDRVDVASLLPPGADPHTYEPVPRDVRRVTETDIAFANGLDLDNSALRIIEQNLRDGAPLVQLGEEVWNRPVARPASDAPHLWMGVRDAKAYAAIVRDELSQVDPNGSPAYEDGYRRFARALDEADTYLQEAVSTIPEGSRKLVTTHDAFGYFARASGLEVAAFAVASPGQDPSPGDIADLARAIADQGVPAVFTEPQIGAASRLLEQAAADAGVHVCTLYSDTLDDRVPTYIDMMRFNADELVRCLGDSGG